MPDPAGDHFGGTIEGRLARVETQLDGAITEIRKLRDRSHEIAEKLAPIVLAFNPDEQTTLAVTLRQHMQACERRSVRLGRAMWAIGGIMLSVLGVLLKAALHL